MSVVHRGVTLRYGVAHAALPPHLASTFRAVPPDAATFAWIDDSIAHPNSKAKLAARSLATRFMSDYDANALFATHDMRVLGRAQLERFLGPGPHGSLLDVGAGDGHVTDELAPLFADVETTELSTRMGERLRERGYVCHTLDVTTTPHPRGRAFDTVALLNVIDRTPRPITLLERCRDLLAPGGRILLATPLPLAPHVHVGSRTVDPEELLPRDKRSFEHAATTLTDVVFRGLGLDVIAWCRAPYLSRGDGHVPAYVLDDAIFLLGVRAAP
jgi:SAM-dependent methyltransferase